MKVENGYLVFAPYDPIKIKKITGHSFVDLLGINKFVKRGDALLSLHGVCSEKVDPKYLRRGDFAEYIAKIYYQREGHVCITYDKKEIGYDNFKENKTCGGIIDIEMPAERSLVEVKSKSLKDYNLVINNPPANELYQGMFYAYLRGYVSFNMFWLFFDENTENEIFAGVKPTSLKNIKKFEKEYFVDTADIKNKIAEAEAIVENFRKEKRIPLSEISPKYIELLKTKGVVFD